MTPANTVPVWDISIRIFHWALVAGFAVAYLTGEMEVSLHENAGYIILGLLLYRLLWGFIGSRYARFSSFVFSPAETFSYIGSLLRLKPEHYLGHNPAGALMVFALLTSLALAVVSGILLQIDENELFEEVHEFFSHLCLLLVLAHIAGVVVAGKLEGQNLVKAMLTGRKQSPDNTSE